MSYIRESKTLKELYEIKDEAWEEVKHLDLRSAIKKRLSDSAETLRRWKQRKRDDDSKE